MTFLDIRFLDLLDIFVVAFLMYQFYNLIRGTTALNIFAGIFSVYLIWLLVKALNMRLLGSILGQVMGVGVMALLIVFQQEIRKFLLLIGSQYLSNKKFSVDHFFSFLHQNVQTVKVDIEPIVLACQSMAQTNTGALIALARRNSLAMYSSTGDTIKAEVSCNLLESIFFKNSPLHDGAVVIREDRIVAARCVLPVTEQKHLPSSLGLRHKAALGLAESSDAFVIAVSEETGKISVAFNGKLQLGVSPEQLRSLLQQELEG